MASQAQEIKSRVFGIWYNDFQKLIGNLTQNKPDKTEEFKKWFEVEGINTFQLARKNLTYGHIQANKFLTLKDKITIIQNAYPVLHQAFLEKFNIVNEIELLHVEVRFKQGMKDIIRTFETNATATSKSALISNSMYSEQQQKHQFDLLHLLAVTNT